jgi:hypothetical protein
LGEASECRLGWAAAALPLLAAANPNPTWVAPPGTSLHRYGTELDLGPLAAYGWLAANTRRFGLDHANVLTTTTPLSVT